MVDATTTPGIKTDDFVGTTVGVTISLETSAPLSGTQSLKIDKDAVDRQGTGVYTPFSYDPGYEGLEQGISFLNSSSVNYADDDIIVYVDG